MFRVSRDCLDLGLRAAAVVFRGVRITESSVALRERFAAEVNRVRGQYTGMAEARAAPELVRLSEILKAVGVKPRRTPPSIDRLLQLAIKKAGLPAINNLVDAYNLVSLRFNASLGAHDLDRITSPVELRLLQGDEPFVPLGRNETMPVTAGEFGYVDAASRLLCRLDVLQADFSKVTTETSNALVIVEATTAHDRETRKAMLEAAVDLIQRECGGTPEVIDFSD